MNHNHKHEHHHHDVDNISGVKLFWVTVLNATITIAEIIGGILSGSLALLSDAIHNLSDTLAIVLSYYALKISKKEKSLSKTYGYKRAQVLAAFINSATLIVISVYLLFEAYKRFLHPEEIKSNLMIIVASIGLISNFISVYLLEKDSHKNMNIKASYLHLIADTVSSVGVVLGGFAIKFWNLTFIDPLITVFISLFIIREAWFIVRQTVDILMQSSANLDYYQLKDDIENIEKVINIHHIHTWNSDEKTVYFEAHVILEDILISETDVILEKIEKLLREKHGVNHITIQFESKKANCSKEMFNIKNKEIIHDH